MKIDDNLNEKLRKRYNPEGSSLRKQQLIMLDILKVLDEICRRHNIKYWLSYGTLLGAVRHGGFIPWDDDLDVEMEKEDYNKLMKVLETELPQDYVLHNHESDSNFLLFFSKIRYVKSYVEEYNSIDLKYKYRGIFVDIFCLEKSGKLISKLAGLIYGISISLVNSINSFFKIEIIPDRIIYNFYKCFVFNILRMFLINSSSNKLYESLGSCFSNVRYRDRIYPLKELCFEGKTFYVPNDSDFYLRTMYGDDYMILPDENKRRIHNLVVKIED